MSRKTRFALFALVILSFAGSAGLLLVAARWLQGSAFATTAVARVAERFLTHRHAPTTYVATGVPLDGLPDARVADTGSTFFTGDDERLPFAVIDGGSEFETSLAMNHETPGLRRLLRERRVKVVWFERDGREYAIRDADTFERAQRIVEPMESLGHAMGQVGGHMGRIGAHQGKVGAEMGRLGGELGALEAERSQLRINGGDDEFLRRQIRAVRADMDRAREQMEHSSDRTDMEEARSRMQELRARHVGVEKRVREQMRTLIEESLRDGRAQRLDSGV